MGASRVPFGAARSGRRSGAALLDPAPRLAAALEQVLGHPAPGTPTQGRRLGRVGGPDGGDGGRCADGRGRARPARACSPRSGQQPRDRPRRRSSHPFARGPRHPVTRPPEPVDQLDDALRPLPGRRRATPRRRPCSPDAACPIAFVPCRRGYRQAVAGRLLTEGARGCSTRGHDEQPATSSSFRNPNRVRCATR